MPYKPTYQTSVMDKEDVDTILHLIQLIEHNSGSSRQTTKDKRKKEAYDAACKELDDLIDDIGRRQTRREPLLSDDPVLCQSLDRLRDHVERGLANPIISKSGEYLEKLNKLFYRCFPKAAPEAEEDEKAPEREAPRNFVELGKRHRS